MLREPAADAGVRAVTRRWRPRGALLLAAAVAVAALGAGCGGEAACWGYGFEFYNTTSSAISVVFQAASDGRETAVAASIASGTALAGGMGVGCREAGVLIARDRSGREVARRDKADGEPSPVWVIAGSGPAPATIVNRLRLPVRRVEFTGRSGTPVVVARDLAPGASASLDAATLGDQASVCWGRLDAYTDRQGLPTATRSVATCASWSWTVSPATPQPTYP